MITPFNLYKLLIGNFYPKCAMCKHYKSGVVSNGFCKLYGDILEARITKNAHLCGISGMSFIKKQECVKQHNTDK